MPGDPKLIAALKTALDADPTATAVRTHLVEVLLDGDEAAAAWEVCSPLLVSAPGDPAVLELAIAAAEAAGHGEQAATYRALLLQLCAGASPAPAEEAPPTEPVRAQPVASDAEDDDPFGDEADAFLRDVLREDDLRRVSLADVGGLADVKHRLEVSFLAPLRHPELRMAYGKSLRGGLLLWGPPGCGKTFLARAVAGEVGATFLSVGIHEILDMWLGNSERNVHGLFEAARRARPCVLFFDEVDALGQARSPQGGSAMRNVVGTLLAELDGANNDNEGVFVLAATNQPWAVDPALRRPGRLDRTLLVLPPDRDARLAILQLHLRHRPVEGLDLGRLATRTDGYSGSDLRLVCETATELAFEEATTTGNVRPITQTHLDAALAQVGSSLGPWFESARNFVSYANDTGEYDELAAYLRRRRR